MNLKFTSQTYLSSLRGTQLLDGSTGFGVGRCELESCFTCVTLSWVLTLAFLIF